VKPLFVATIGVLMLSACGGEDGAPGPVVDQIDEAIEAVELHYGTPQQFFEISATIEEVNFIVAVDAATAAEQGSYLPDGGFTVPEPVGPASGSTFAAEAIDFDPDRIFEQIRTELVDPVIVDFAIQGTSSGTVVYDATVASESGGVLLVLLGPNGEILGAQAQ
jgi:hypothetical protein